jgi:hypothetical protein
MSPELADILTNCGVATFTVLATLGVQALARHKTRPRLRVDFRENDERFVLRTHEGILTEPFPRADACFLRIRVSNAGRRTAKDCRVHLVNWERWDRDRWAPTNPRYCDSIPLKWSYETDAVALAGVDIPPGTWRFADVLSARQGSQQFRVETPTFPTYCEPLLESGDRLRFTIQVSAEDAPPRRAAIEFTWSGHWGMLKAKSLDADGRRAVSGEEP